MNNNITPMFEDQRDMVEFLESMLESAKSGELENLLLICTEAEQTIWFKTGMSTTEAVGYCSLLSHCVAQSWHEGPVPLPGQPG